MSYAETIAALATSKSFTTTCSDVEATLGATHGEAAQYKDGWSAQLCAQAVSRAQGIGLPDMGLDKAFVAIFGCFAAALVLWAVLRFTPSWKAKLNSDPGLALLGKINPPLLLIVIAASGVFLLSDSWLLLVPMFLGVPIAVLGILMELIWGYFAKPADQDDSRR